MWHFLSRMKQPDGGFTMSPGGEEDVRGAYCAVVIASLLRLPLTLPASERARLPGLASLTDGLAAWVGRCQSYEGGIAESPGNEAHGAYAFCGLGCLSVLGPPHETIPRYLDVDRLLEWLSHRQDTPAGGFAGRTNKLVDGCYSHWVGGCWALLEAALRLDESRGGLDALWDREGLTRYVLCCAQAPSGGLRDKPSKRPDGYHTNYNLAGLSAAQNHYVWRRGGGVADGELGGGADDDDETQLNAAFAWTVGRKADVPCDEQDQVDPVHPVYVIKHSKAEAARRYFDGKEGF